MNKICVRWESHSHFPGVQKFPKLGLLWLWDPITLCDDLRLKWGLKKCYSPWQFDSRPLKVGNHLAIFFQWHNKLFNPMGFNPCNCSLKIQKSIRTPTPQSELHKVGVHLGVWRFIPSHSPTLPGAWNVTLGLHSWPVPLQALTLVTSPRLGLWQQGNKGVQTHEKPTNANENNAIKGKEPQAIIGTPT
jgi:hypothetical protein